MSTPQEPFEAQNTSAETEGRRSFTDLFIKHPVLAVVVNLVIILVGWRALTGLPVQQYPQIESSSVLITTVYYGASAETVRGFLTTPIERVVSAISGVDYVESTSRAGVSTVTVRLKLDHNSTAALAEVTARLQQVRAELPAEAQPPVVEVQRADRPYASFYLSFSSNERSAPAVTDWLARTLQPQLSTLPGVQRVSIEGGQPIAMRVWIDPQRLAALNLAPGDVHSALRRNNYLAAVGQTKSDLVQVNLLANTDLRSVEEFEQLIVADRDGAIVRLADVARVELGAEEADMVAKFSEQEAVYLGVWPLVGVNEIDVAHGLREEMERIRPELPADIDMRLAYDATVFMEDALKEITKTLSETILIVGLVVFLFLGSVRTALIPLVAMPISLVGAAIVMFAFGFSLNLLTILAIVLSVGLVVDDAIVVVENVERHVRMGKSRLDAALIGARELVGPIIAMTITLAAVYTPIGFQGGLTGSLFLEFAITLAAAVVVSGFVAVTLSPVMSAYFVHPPGHEGRLTALVNRGFDVVRDRYARLLDGALGIRWAIVAASFIVLAAAWPLYQFSRRELAPIEDQSHITMFMEASPDASLAASNRASLEVVRRITAFPEAEFMWSLTAPWGGFGGLVAKDWKERERSTEEMYGEVYGAVSTVPGLRVFPRLDPPLPTPGQYDVELVLQSDAPPEQMLETVGAVVGAGWQSGKFLYVDTDLKIDLPEARVVIDRERVADLGLDLASVGQELGTLLGGGYVNRFNFFDRSYKVIPQIGEADRATVAPLLDLKIKTPGGDLVPVSSFTRIESSTAPRVLNRFQQQNAVRVFAGVRPGVTKEEGLSILESAAAATSGPRVIIDHAGESRQIRREGKALTATLGFAIVLIYLVLAAQFQSFRDPLIVLLGSVPLAISSALVFSFLDFTTINIYSQVGLITLVGLIAKNGILIVQFANTLQSRGVAKMEALREASLTRLRPVLMTSAATVFGHLPLVFVTGPGSEARHSIGTVLVSGMAIGTIFTLFVVPVFYSLIAAERSRVPVSASRPERAHPILPGAPAEGWALSSTRALMLTVALLGVTTLALSAQAPMSVATPTSATSAGNVSGRPSPSPLVHASSDTASRDEFWVAIADTTLNRLLEEARLGSYQLKASAARRDGAGAARLHAGLDLLPAVSARAGYTRRRLPSASFPGAGPGVFPAQDVWESGLDLSWEVDLFGRLRRGLSARAALLGSAGQDLSQMQLEVTSELARSYFGLRGSQGQLAVARRNAENQRRILELARKRHDAGRGTAFDTERAQAQLSFTLAAIPLLEEQVASAQSHIAVLVGRDSEALAAELAGDGGLPELPEELPQLDAAEVLAARPDVLGAHERLSASRASVSAARADYLPRLTLTAGVGYSAAKVNAFGDDGTLNYVVGPVVSWAAFDLGRVKARVEEAEAYEAEARAQYEHVAMLGREDLETASTRYRTARARLTHLRDAAGASERAASLALARYEGGVADFLQVLDAERTLLAAQDQLARGETDVAEAYVALYRARAGRLTLVP